MNSYGTRHSFLVETSQDHFTEVRADSVSFEGGAAIFFDHEDEGTLRLGVAYAPGQWLTVVEDGDQ